MTQSPRQTVLRSPFIPVTDPDAGLRITEIFYSLQGEALSAGLPTVFVRLTGCPLRCVYCDTAYAFSGGQRLSLDAILAAIAQYPCQRICITGGEPLAQPNCIALMQRLLDAGYEISLETAGALSVQNVPIAVSKVMDLKTPSSGEHDKNLWSNLDYLTEHDQLKFVIMNRIDYDWAKAKVTELALDTKVATVWFSPMFNIDGVDNVNIDGIDNVNVDDVNNVDNNDATSLKTTQAMVPDLARHLAQWILTDALPVRLQLQLHKIIWADAKGK